MPVKFTNKLIVAISSRALFDLEESHYIYENEGVDAYCKYQVEHENQVLDKGVAYNLVEKLLALKDKQNNRQVEVILISRNSSDTGLRIFNSIEHHKLDITRAAFTGGNNPYRYIKAFNAHLFLSADQQDVKNTLQQGYAAASILPSNKQASQHDELRIAFDGDAVLFSDEAERVFQFEGLDAFTNSEKKSAKIPLPGGPFKNVLSALHRIQSDYAGETQPIRTALFTARSAPAHERVIRTLRTWNIRIDEAVFLGGLDKGEFLKTFGADIFFDDQRAHCDSTRKHVPTGHVPHSRLEEIQVSKKVISD